MTITNGQARRISAAWQAPRNPYSLLQHMGVIDEHLAPTIIDDLKKVESDPNMYVVGDEDPKLVAAELRELLAWVEEQGVGKIPDWGPWDDAPVKVPS